jgi:hypothetical protein
LDTGCLFANTDPEELLALRIADQVIAVVEDERKAEDKVLDIAKQHIKNK